MPRPPIPPDEDARLRALRSYEVLDTPPEEAFDGLTRLAAQICATPIALVSLVDAERQWFKSRLGLAQSEMPRELFFCAHAIAQPGLMVVEDARLDPRFAGNPLVTGEPRLRFYAGAPLRTPDGHALGTLSVLDTVGRVLTPEQRDALVTLARQAELLLELRRRLAELRAAQAERERAEGVVRESISPLRAPRASTATIGVAPPRSRWLLPAAILALGAALSVLAAWASDRRASQLSRVLLERSADRIGASVRARFSALEEVLYGAQSMVSSRGSVGREEWARFVGQLELERRHPGISGLALVEVVPRAGLAAFEERLRAELGAAYAVRPAGERAVYYPVRLIEPAAPNRPAFGFDVASEPVRLAAAQRAAETGAPSISARVLLLQDDGSTAGVLAFLPLYARPGASGRGPRGAPSGFVYAPVRLRELLDSVGPESGLQFALFDGPRASTADLLYDSAPGQAALEAASDGRLVSVAGRDWTLVARRVAPDPGGSSREPALVLAGGLVASALLAGVVLAFTSAGRRAVVLASGMTEALRESEARTRAVVDGVADAILVYDLRGRLGSWNRACEAVFGYLPSELHGRAVDTLVEGLLARSGEGRFEGVARRSDGLSLPVEIAVTPVSRGKGFVAVARDVSERRRSEEALRESEERYRDLFEGASDLIQAVAPDGRLLYANRAWCEALGYTEEETASLRLLDVIHPDHRGETLDLFQWVLEGGQVETGEFIFVSKDGRRIVAEGSVTCRRVDGRPVSTRAILRDVTERRKAEEALRVSEARTRSILDNMLGGLITVSARGIIESVNPAARRIFGHSEEELVGRHLSLLMAPVADQETFLRDAFQRALGRVSEWQGRRADGQLFPFELSMFEFQTPAGRFYAGSIQDVSERREVERLKKEFVSTVSHELRTPLTSIRGSLSLLAGGVLGDLPDEAKDVLAIAERNVVRLIGLINDILDLERLETGRIEMHMADVPLAEVFARSVEAVRAVAEQQQIRIDVRPSEAIVRGDGDRLVQVVVNLLGNAVKFSPAGAPVTLEATEAGDLVEVRVVDRGRGVPRQAQQAIFERFKQVEASDQREKGGTGLGLAICRTIVEQHHGAIGVISEEGRGSIFWFRLPSARAHDPFLVSLHEPALAAADGPPGDVVLADRDEAMLGVMARQLLREGLAVRTATSGGAALALLEERAPALLVLDLEVSGPDGFGVVEALRARPALASLPVLVYTDRDVSAAERERLGAGRLAYLTKSRASEEEFRRQVQELLAPGGRS
jgi:PAS domain S-box-containing protein